MQIRPVMKAEVVGEEMTFSDLNMDARREASWLCVT